MDQHPGGMPEAWATAFRTSRQEGFCDPSRVGSDRHLIRWSPLRCDHRLLSCNPEGCQRRSGRQVWITLDRLGYVHGDATRQYVRRKLIPINSLLPEVRRNEHRAEKKK